jgi:histidinol-phosphate aminotransferase
MYRLSANENPFPPLPSVLEAAHGATGRLNRYPEMYSQTLAATLAARYRVPVEHVVPGIGSVGVTQQLLQACAGEGDEVLYAWPSFEAYPDLTAMSGARSVRVPLAGETHDLAAMAAAITPRTRVAVVCNPNNPTGTAVRRAELERFLDQVPERVLVVLDEAYREFVRDVEVPDGIELYRDRPRVVVLRTFSKAYGLANLRVGFAVAHQPVADALRSLAVPFGVTGVAQAAAVASLAADAERELLERVDSVVKERDRVVGGLRDAGWEVPDTQANFCWLRLGEHSARFAEACAGAGVVVRAFPGLGVRISIGEPEANDLVLRVAAAFPVR